MLMKKTVEAILESAGIEINGSQPHDIQVHRPRMFRRIAAFGLLGLGESYMDGDWDCQHLDEFCARVVRVKPQQRPMNFLMLPAWIRANMVNLQSRSRAIQVCRHHYDLGNDLFEKMLDSNMVYSCGYWRKAVTLDEAQIAKMDLICRKLQLKTGMRILDMGCGWGSLLKYAAEHYGVQCVGYSLSVEQTTMAKKLCAGLPIEFELKDYREVRGQFDRIVSVGMLEAVGPRNYRTFMETVAQNLKPDGIALVHTVGGNRSHVTPEPWFSKYIFPNGILPSVRQIGHAVEDLLTVEDWHNFGPDYDLTLMAWNENFQRNWGILSKSYPARFKRMWEFYLLSMAGGFRARFLHLWQIILTHPGRSQEHDWRCS